MGEGYPILLQHGLTSSHEAWYGRAKAVNYVEALQEKYQVILLDARGHGKSSKPHAPEKYAMKYMVNDVVAVLDELNIDKAIFWGYSMGGRIGLATGKYAPNRFSALIIGGNGLVEKDSKEEIEELQGYIRLFERGTDYWIDFLENLRGSKLKDWEYDKWRNADLDGYIAYMSYYEDIGMAQYLPKLGIPCLFYAGEKDVRAHSAAMACADIMQNAEFISFPGLNHSGASIGSAKVLPHVLKFLEKVT
jgi:pimeloyl-ACP methyl ester carboxylesterase